MPTTRTSRVAARNAARAAMVCSAAAVMMTAVRFVAQDARPDTRTDAQGPRASMTSKLFDARKGLAGLGAEKFSIEIAVPDGTSGTKIFVGEIGSHDEADFISQDGSDEVMRVTSLDDGLATLIAVRVQGQNEVGTAFAFRRQGGDGSKGLIERSEYRLKWSARGMDSTVAIDVDTYLELHGGSISKAVRASQRRPSLPVRSARGFSVSKS